MAVNVPNPGLYVQQLGSHATAFRDSLQALLNDAAYLNAQGGASFLQNSLGMAPADATAVVTVIGAVIPSNTTVQAVQAFIASTEFLWGGN